MSICNDYALHYEGGFVRSTQSAGFLGAVFDG